MATLMVLRCFQDSSQQAPFHRQSDIAAAVNIGKFAVSDWGTATLMDLLHKKSVPFISKNSFLEQLEEQRQMGNWLTQVCLENEMAVKRGVSRGDGGLQSYIQAVIQCSTMCWSSPHFTTLAKC